MGKIFLIANTNFNNDKIMNEKVIKKWNKVVSDNDTIYLLGNFGIGTFIELKEIFDRLKGEKYLVLGENDFINGKEFYLNLGFKEVYEENVTIGKYVLTHYPTDVNSDKINIYGSNNHDDLLENFKNKNYVCVSLERINCMPIMLKEK